MTGGIDVDIKNATLYDVEIVACISLRDDLYVFCRDRLLDQGTEDEIG